MYLELFKLTELPFRLSPDPAFLYPSQIHSRAKAYMESTIWFTDGFVVITGEIGSGKTTLIETFLKEIEKDVVVAQINQTQISPIEFLQTLLAQFGFSPFRMRKAELLATLNKFLIEQYANGRRVLLIVDEAQNLSNKVLEEIRLLSGVETTKEKVLRIILAGQPELNDKLNSPELVQLEQRMRLRFHLNALDQTEMTSYIQHRLEVAGSEGREIFAPETFDLIYRYTGGIPRLVNTLCDTAMMAAFAEERRNRRACDDGSRGRRTAVARIRERTAHEPAGAAARRHRAAGAPAGGPRRAIPEGQTISESLLVPGRFIIGRTPDNDLQIDSKYISRHHAQIVTSDEGTVLEDLNSTNGVYLNAPSACDVTCLTDGDVVQIGMHELIDTRTASTAGRRASAHTRAVPDSRARRRRPMTTVRRRPAKSRRAAKSHSSRARGL